MFSRTAMHRSAAILASAALAVGAAGCGGSDSDSGGGGDSGAYASTWNDVCQSLTTAQTTLQSEGAAAQKKAGATNAATIQKALTEPAGKFIDSLIAALDKVKDLDAPSEFKSFQDQVKSTAPTTIAAFEKIKEPVESGDTAAFQKAFQQIDADKTFPAPPAALKKQATACNSF